ncbi:transglutaminaseTgpA domain-containing protein [Plantibacter sp. Mn2098]|uniref:transglutaminase family protein n=1 Tax=Plantibacter sp. Mn2098 TaxID=3395266 RepID=UPI003BD09DDE
MSRTTNDRPDAREVPRRPSFAEIETGADGAPLDPRVARRTEQRAARSRARDTATEGDLRLAVASFLLLALGGLGFGRVIERLDWWFVTLLVMAVILGVAVTLRHTGLNRVFVWIGVVVGAVAIVTLLFAPGTAIAGVIPTSGTLRAFAALRDAGFTAFREGAAPLDSSSGLIFIMAAGGAIVTVVVTALVLGLHAPVWAGVLVAAVYAAPAIAVSVDVNPVLFAMLAAAFLWLLREDVKRRDRIASTITRRQSGGAAPAFIVSAIAIVVALLTPVLLPGIASTDTPAGARGTGPFAGGINPLISLGQNLRQPQNTTALEYTTTAISAPYLKVTDLHEFSGAVWAPDNAGYEVGNTIDAFPTPQGLSPDITTDDFTTNITIESLASPWLPIPYPTTKVKGLEGDWRWEGAGLTAMGQGASTNRQTYAATSLAVMPTAQQMRNAPPLADQSAFAPYLALPDAMPPIIEQTTLDVTATASTAYDRAIALQRYFRGNFEYSETAPVEQGFDGSGAGVIAIFLERKSGYCVHFSSAMAVMARQLGIPSRIAIGYLPGNAASDATATGKEKVYVVTSNQLHAWPELYFEGIGWVPFEPTASRGTATSFADASTTTPGQTGPITAPTTGPTRDPSIPADRGNTGTAQSAQQSALPQALLPGAIVLGVLVLLAVPVAARGIVRVLRRRRGERDGAGGPAGAAWSEFLANAVDLGFPVTLSESPRSFVQRLQTQFQVEAPEIDALLALVERESYAGPGGVGRARGAGAPMPAGTARTWAGEVSRALDDATGALRATCTPMERFLGTFFPRSLIVRSTDRPVPGAGPVL